MTNKTSKKNAERHNDVHMPANSILYERIVPALLLLMAFVMIVILLVALGVLVGLIPYQ